MTYEPSPSPDPAGSPRQEADPLPLLASLAYAGVPLHVVGRADRPEWVARNFFRILNRGNPTTVLKTFDATEVKSRLVDVGGVPSRTQTLTELGLCRLVWASRLPEAKALRDWIQLVVLPRFHLGDVSAVPDPAPPHAAGAARGFRVSPAARPKPSDPALMGGEPLLTPWEAVTLPWVVARYGGKILNPAAVTLWRRVGHSGVKLRTVLAGRRRYTSESAVREFFAAVDRAALRRKKSPPRQERMHTPEAMRPADPCLLNGEPLLTLAEVSRLPAVSRRYGRALSASSRFVYRWAGEGMAGVKLECVRPGPFRYSSEAAVGRFFDAIDRRKSAVEERQAAAMESARTGATRTAADVGPAAARRTEEQRREAKREAEQVLRSTRF